MIRCFWPDLPAIHVRGPDVGRKPYCRDPVVPVDEDLVFHVTPEPSSYSQLRNEDAMKIIVKQLCTASLKFLPNSDFVPFVAQASLGKGVRLEADRPSLTMLNWEAGV